MSYFVYQEKSIYYEKIGNGSPIILLHGNTASSKMFMPIIPLLTDSFTVIIMDFLGCGKSDRLVDWPADLWYEWGLQVAALCHHLNLSRTNVIGCSGGALAAINFALEYPDLTNAVIADSFLGIRADADLTQQIITGRSYAKQTDEFCVMLKDMHGDDWEEVFDADTNALTRHAQEVIEFFHHPLSEIQVKLMLTGSATDEMFPKGHCEKLFGDICAQTRNAKSKLFMQGTHPAMLSNQSEFVDLIKQFCSF